jgi:hypothetical protein
MPNPFHVDMQVRVRYRGGKKFFPAKISRVGDDGTYDIDYKNGKKEISVKPEFIEAEALEASLDHKKNVQFDLRASSKKFELNQKVMARYRGKKKFYSGKISGVHPDNTYNIEYDDGMNEMRVSEELIEFDVSESRWKSKYTVEMKIEARYAGRGKYFPGKISRDREDGTYDIHYDDGEKEICVAEDLIREVVPSSHTPEKKKPTYQVGENVKARPRGKTKYEHCVVTASYEDATYDVRYDGGDLELHIPDSAIKALPPPSVPITVGTKVMVIRRQEKVYSAGVIQVCHDDGKYDIDFDDGIKEHHVEPEAIRRISPQTKASVRLGVRVMASFKYGRRFHPGVISKVRPDDTCDVTFDVGKKGTFIPLELIDISDEGLKQLAEGANSSKQAELIQEKPHSGQSDASKRLDEESKSQSDSFTQTEDEIFQAFLPSEEVYDSTGELSFMLDESSYLNTLFRS